MKNHLLLHLIKGDLRFQQKYGIWLVYIIFTLFYILLLRLIPHVAVDIVGQILIYTDPAAMGLFFMGAIILLEKSQRVNCAISVSPVTIDYYIVSKAFSLLVPGMIVCLIVFLCGRVSCSLLSFVSIAISSILFSLCGLLVAVKTNTLNAFTIATVPFEIVMFLPAVFYQLGYLHQPLFLLHPGVAAMTLVKNDITIFSDLLHIHDICIVIVCLLSLILWTGAIYLICKKAVRKFFAELGGGKL